MHPILISQPQSMMLPPLCLSDLQASLIRRLATSLLSPRCPTVHLMPFTFFNILPFTDSDFNQTLCSNYSTWIWMLLFVCFLKSHNSSYKPALMQTHYFRFLIFIFTPPQKRFQIFGLNCAGQRSWSHSRLFTASQAWWEIRAVTTAQSQVRRVAASHRQLQIKQINYWFGNDFVWWLLLSFRSCVNPLSVEWELLFCGFLSLTELLSALCWLTKLSRGQSIKELIIKA